MEKYIEKTKKRKDFVSKIADVFQGFEFISNSIKSVFDIFRIFF